ncbi:pectate lyase-like adhesive domain-containing protein [Enterococcus sp. LJL120]
MKNRKKHWLLLINFIAVFSLIAVTIVQLSSGAMEIFAAPKELSLSTEEDLTQLKAGDEFVVTISDSRDESDIATTENTEVPFVDKSGDITAAENAANAASVSRQWRMTLPEGITFDETAEKATLTAATASGITPVIHFDQETRILDITVNASITKLALSLTAETAGEYEISVADKNIMLTDSEKLAVVVGEAEEFEEIKPKGTVTNLAVQPLITDPQAIQVVTTWDEFVEALGDTSINQITLGNDITLSGTLTDNYGVFSNSSVDLSTGYGYLFVSKAAISRNLIIDGGKYTFDFGNLAISFTDASVNTSSYWNITMQNINVKSANPYAPFYYPVLTGAGNGGISTSSYLTRSS